MRSMASSSGSCWPLLVIWTTCAVTAACALLAQKALHAVAGPTVDLGYATYQGYYNETYDLNVWKGIRYAAPPVGNLRWQAPREPPQNNAQVTPAIDQPPLCPQSGAFGTPEEYGFNSGPGDEDCLYLNVYAAPDSTGLPVLVWIHGGGYSVFGAEYDPSEWLGANDNGFIAVEIQYRLGAFGFLASAGLKAAGGQLNAGLLDQRFALEWVQQHAAQFGGDPSRVTIAGESAGAGSVLYHATAYGGVESGLFTNIIAASPWIPGVYRYDDPVPTARYEKFAELAGCSDAPDVFACLVSADTVTLQNASGTVSTTIGSFGSFGFVPVVDDDFIRERPAVALSRGAVSGKRLLVGTNANEGVPLTNPTIKTQAEYDDFVAQSFPLFTAADAARLRAAYRIGDPPPPDEDERLLYDTLGFAGPTALTKSGVATGLKQAVLDIGAETTYDCPAQWFAEAFSSSTQAAWKYQYSVTPSYHGADLGSYFSLRGSGHPNADFARAMRKIWGAFVVRGTPVISVDDATAGKSNATVPIPAPDPVPAPGPPGSGPAPSQSPSPGTGPDHPIRDGRHSRGGVEDANANASDVNIDWPAFTAANPVQMTLNTTGGTVVNVTITPDLSYLVRTGPGIVNNFSLANAYSWEGGRGKRCAFWRDVSERVPQ